MRVHITNIYGFSPTSVALMAQNMVTDIAKQMGFNELSIYIYNIEADENLLNTRLDGIIASVGFGDIVVFQSPTWNDIRFDETLMTRLSMYHVKKILFIHDFTPLMFVSDDEFFDRYINFLNTMDLLIVPSEKMLEVLRNRGLTVEKIIIQHMWDHVHHYSLNTPKFDRKIYFTGNPERFPFVKDWNKSIPLTVFSLEKNFENANVIYEGWQAKDDLLKIMSKGGFGLVWSEHSANNYYDMNVSYKLSTFLAAGIPVIVPSTLSNAHIVKDNQLGLVVNHLDEAIECIHQMSEADYNQMLANVSKYQFLLQNGYFTKKLLTDAIFTVMQDKLPEAVALKKDTIKVLDIDNTLNYILKHKSSVARFGDGEMDIISGHSIPYQDYDENLAGRLSQIMAKDSQPNFVVCLSDVFENLDRYNDNCNYFWKGHLERFMPKYKALCKASWYGSTFISRPYIDLKDKSKSSQYFEKLKQLWRNQDILIVEGLTSRSGVGNDLFDEAKSVSRIICPSKNAFSKIDQIQAAIETYGQDKLILVMLGPTAKVLSDNLQSKGYWIVDIGHIDSEYEWFKMGAMHKVKLNHKHTAEHNFDENIVFEHNEQYNQQIITVID